MGGWQQYSIVDATGKGVLHKVDTTHVPLSACLGAVGMTGVTAWYGLTKICQPRAGDTISVSAASGAVDSVVGQLAKARSCRAVGFAGGPDKCRYVVDEGFIVSEHMEAWPVALAELGGMVASGKLKYRESVAHGIESAPETFLGLLKGKNFGKQLVTLI